METGRLCCLLYETEREVMNVSITRFLKLIWKDAGMKRDVELPWYLRIARWAAVAFGIAYGALLIIEKAKAVL